MTVSTMAKDARPEMELAQSSSAVVPVAAAPRTIISVFAVADGHQHWLGNRVVELDELEELLLADAGDGTLEVTLRGAFDLPWEAMRPVMDACAEAGVQTLQFATFEP
jgi:biopolymer transport protein ExbD